MKNKTFKQELSRLMRLKSRELKAKGTISLSIANFCQLITPPSPTLENAPSSPAEYRELFEDLCQGSKLNGDMLTL